MAVLSGCAEDGASGPSDAWAAADAPETVGGLASLSAGLTQGGACCATSSEAGCLESACEACVCAADPYCCNWMWDSHCGAVAATPCQSQCECASACEPLFGDLNADSAVSVTDVQCAILAVLAELSGDVSPACLAGPALEGDTDCNDAVAVGDVLIVIGRALGNPLSATIDADADGCPDACNHQPDAACAQGGTFCDDGDRCTLDDVCSNGVCVPGAPSLCSDDDPCTTESCDPVQGCQSQLIPNCKQGCGGPEVPDDGIDSDCDGKEALYSALNLLTFTNPIGPGAFSTTVSGNFDLGPFGVTPVTGTLERASTGAPVTWCVSATVNATVGPLTLSGLNVSVCRDAFGTVTTAFDGNLVWQGANVAVSGTFALSSPLTVTVSVQNLPLNPNLVVLDAMLTATLGQVTAALTGKVRAGDPSEAAEIWVSGSYRNSGSVTLAVGLVDGAPWTPFESVPLSFDTLSGTVTRTQGNWSASITASTASAALASGVVLNDVTASATFGSSPAFAITVSASSALGPFNTTVTGSLSKANASAPVTGCLNGSVSGALGALQVQTATAGVCFNGSAPAAVTFSGTLLFEGSPVNFTGTLLPGSPWSITVVVPTISLAGGAIVLQNTTFTIVQNVVAATWSGTLQVSGGGSTLSIDFSGSYASTGSLTLNLAQKPGTTWTPFQGYPLSFSTLGGTLNRTSGAWTVTLSASATSATLATGVTLNTVTASATFGSTGAFSVAVSGQAQLGPFNTTVSGSLSRANATAPVTGCLSGSISGAAGPLTVQSGTVQVCVTGPNTATVTFSGNLNFEGAQVAFTGVLQLAGSWTLTVTVPSLSLASGQIVVQNATFTISQGASIANWSGTVRFGSGPQQLALNFSGIYTATGNLTLTLSKPAGTTWTPFVGTPLTFDTFSGTFRRLSGAWRVVLTASTASATLTPGFTLTNVTANATFTSTPAFSLALTASAAAGPFTLSVTGTLTADATGKLSGCLSGSVANSNLNGVPLSALTLQACSTAGVVTTTLSGNLVFEGKTAPFTATLTLGSGPWSLVATISNVIVSNQFVLQSATLTFTQNASTVGLVADWRLGAGSTALRLRTTANYQTTGALNLNATLQPGEVWTPISTLPQFTFTSLQASLARTSGGVWTGQASATAAPNVELVPGVLLTNTSFAAAFSSLGVWSLTIGGDANLGVLGTLALVGTFAQPAVGAPLSVCLASTLAVNRNISGIGLEQLSAEVCSVNGAPEIDVTANMKIGTQSFPILANLVLGPPSELTVSVEGLELAPGLVLDEVTLGIQSGTVTLDGEMHVGTGPAQAHVGVSGTWSAGGDYCMGVELLSPWTPVASLSLTVNDASGTVCRQAGVTSLVLETSAQGDLPLVPGLVLEGYSLTGSLDSTGNWAVALTGSLDLDLGETNIQVDVSAAIEGGNTLVFQGALPGPIEPFPLLLGDSLVLLDSNVTVTVDLSNSTFEVSLGSTVDLCLPSLGGGDCDHVQFAVEAGVIIGDTVGFYVQGTLPELELPGLGAMNDLIVIASSVDLPSFDLLGTPGNGNDDVDVPAGLCLFAVMDNPIPIPGAEELLVKIGVTLQGSFVVSATIPINWTIIDSEVGHPVTEVELRQIELKGEITPPASVSLAFEGVVVFTPKPNPNAPPPQTECVDDPGSYCGIGRIELAAMAGVGEVEMAFWLEGRVYDPFGLHPFAIENPGITIGIQLAPGAPPFPNSIGFAGTLYWLNTGDEWPTWPINNEPPVLEGYVPEIPFVSDSQPPGVPSNVTQVGGAFYLDLFETKGICFLGGCIPSPQFLVNIDVRNFDFPSDIMGMLQDVVESVRDKFPGNALPPVGFSFSPFEFPLPGGDTEIGIDFERFLLSFATADIELFGKQYKGGLLVDIDMTVNKLLDPSDPDGTNVSLSGQLDNKGVFFEGQVDGFDLFGLNALQIVGNPIAHYAALGGTGSIEIPHAPRFNLTQGTIEGWIKESSIGSTKFAATMLDKSTAAAGYTVGIGQVESGKGRVNVRFRSGSQTLELSTAKGVISPNTWHHVAVVFATDGTGKRYAQIFVDGLVQELTATWLGQPYALYGGAKGNVFQGLPILPANNTVAVKLGQGLVAIDDVRVWNVARTSADISGERRFLNQGTGTNDASAGAGGASIQTDFDSGSFIDDTTLVARYEFDYDPKADTLQAYNTRLQLTGSKHHGTYVGAASPVLYTEGENPTYFKLNMRLPSTQFWAGPPGLWIRTGFVLDLPVPDEIISDVAVMGQLSLTLGSLEGVFYVPEISLLDIPNFGKFTMGGWGPNFVPDDFDDGAFAFADLWKFEFGITAALGLEGPQGNQSVGAEFACTFECPDNTSCAGPQDHELWIYGAANLTIDAGTAGSLFSLEGVLEMVANSADWFVQVAAGLEIAGLTLAQAAASLDKTMFDGEAAFVSSNPGVVQEVTGDGKFNEIDLDGAVNIGFTITFTKPWEVCLNLSLFNGACSASACFGGEKGFSVPILCGAFCAGADVCPGNQQCGCIADFDGFHVGTCYAPASREVGEECVANNQCTTGKCGAELCIKGVCKCDSDSQCAPTEYCQLGLFGDNLCHPKKEDGVGCDDDRQCISGQCGGCIDADGVLSVGWCYSPSSLGFGEDCFANNQCESGVCGAECVLGIFFPGVCKCNATTNNGCSGSTPYCWDNDTPFDGSDNECVECKQNNHCSSTEYCSAGFNCVPKKPNGANCGANYECLGTCSDDGKCYCSAADNGGCSGAAPYCKNNNITLTTDNVCVACLNNSHCLASQFCNSNDACQNDQPIGASCTGGAQCLSGNCSDIIYGAQTCVCSVDTDCPAGQQCYKPGTARNFCGECANNGDCGATEYCSAAKTCLAKKSNGSACTANDECLGTCGSDGKCYCAATNNGGCGGATPFCRNNDITIVTDNVCVACLNNTHCAANQFCNAAGACQADLAIGQSCSGPAQCVTGNCSDVIFGAQTCVCSTDAHCPAGQQCFKPGTSKNFCGECANDGDCGTNQYCSAAKTCLAKKANGATCGANNECLGTCGSDGKCYCAADNNGGCSGGTPYCKNNNITIVTDNVCVACLNNTHCAASQFCNDSNTCQADKAIGQSCSAGAQCITGNCSDIIYGAQTCVCSVNADCPAGQTCFKPGTSKNFCAECSTDGDCASNEYCTSANTCAAKKANGLTCTANNQCLGTCASDGKCYCSATNNGGCGGSTPYCKNNNITIATDNVCVACLSDSNCSASQYCSASNTCLTDKALGGTCTRAAECQSGNCSDIIYGSPQTCVCNANADCPAGETCYKPGTAKNFCGECANDGDCGSNEYCNSADNCVAKKANGSTCSANNECLGTCGSDGKCYCAASGNGGCSGSTPYCKDNSVANATDNVCVACLSDANCTSASFPECSPNNTCVKCTANSHCTSTQYCTGSYTCAAKKFEGTSCGADDECYAECASDGLCGCNTTTNQGCPSSTPYCEEVGGDIFSQADNNCVECKSNSHCGSNEYCGSSGTCLTKKTMGASCTANDQCQTGQCEGGDCVCDNDADCTAKYGSAYDCNKPVVGGSCGSSVNFCKKSNSDYFCE